MSRLRQAAVLAALAAVAAPSYAQAVTARSYTANVLLSGRANSHVDVYISRGIDVEPGKLVGDHCGRYQGVFVERLDEDGPSGAGIVWISGLAAALGDERAPVGLAAGLGGGTYEQSLRRGTYRFHLIAERDCTIRMPGKGLRRDWRVTTTRRTPVSFGQAHFDPVAPGAELRGGEATLFRGRLSGRSLGFVAVESSRPATDTSASENAVAGEPQQHTRWACLRPAGTACQSLVARRGVHSAQDGRTYATTHYTWYEPGDLPAGEYEAFARSYTVEDTLTAVAFAITL